LPPGCLWWPRDPAVLNQITSSHQRALVALQQKGRPMGKERKRTNREDKKPKQANASATPALLSDKGLRPMEILLKTKR
jgi:hypothetical protein